MITKLSRAQGCLLGLAVGDSMGTTLEFGPRRDRKKFHTEMTGGGPFRLEPGEWTDDTAMALALADSLLANAGRLDANHALKNFSDWYEKGKFSCNGRCFDIGNQTRSGITDWQRTGSTINGAQEEGKGNGGLMRLAPAVLCARSAPDAEELAVGQSCLTHSSPECREYAALLGQILFGLLHGGDASDFIAKFAGRARKQVSSSGRARDAFEAACWAVGTTASFDRAIIEAVNLGDDADTVGAITGQIAGAIYGIDAIPAKWRETVAWSDRIVETASRLSALSGR